MKKLLLIFLLAMSLSSCMAPAQMALQGTNPQIRVELLFEVDGCKIYRFYDGGAVRYFTKCENNSSVGWIESCGKNCTFYAENITNYDKAIPVSGKK